MFIGTVLPLAVLGGIAALAYAWGGAAHEVAVCSGAAVKELRGGTYCTIWLTQPTTALGR